ncbi:hypothetical protein LCGC14_2640860 [marine sediment metagenome]|uniref:Uncharacterized protein n=1 Tax=marine sediment metagenome TaxID=412755 RepID=A0A0F8ZXP3_9ZZZZ
MTNLEKQNIGEFEAAIKERDRLWRLYQLRLQELRERLK